MPNSVASVSTAIVQILDNYGKYQKIRAVLDVGSQPNLLTESATKKLNKYSGLSGINQSESNINKSVTIKFKSRHNAFQTAISCLILP